MPLSSYDELKTSIADWLGDDAVSTAIPDFITLAEANLNDLLRLSPMERHAVAHLHGSTLYDPDSGAILTGDFGELYDDTAPAREIVLPDDFLEMRTLVVNTSPSMVIPLAAPGGAIDLYQAYSGWPYVYTIAASILTIYPYVDAPLNLIYYRKIPPLSATNATNWLLTRWPQIYLYASLLEAQPYLHDDQRALVWQAKLSQAIEMAKQADLRGRWANAGLVLAGATP